MSTPTPEHPDPGAEAAARAVQLAAMTVSVAEAVARLRAHRLQRDTDIAARQDAAERADGNARAAAARTVYSAALDDTWRREAATSRLLDAWAAAQDHLHTDPKAALAVDRIEARLRQLHPEAMSAYYAARAGGFPRPDSLDIAAMRWRGEYGLDPIGTPVEHHLANVIPIPTLIPNPSQTPTPAPTRGASPSSEPPGAPTTAAPADPPAPADAARTGAARTDAVPARVDVVIGQVVGPVVENVAAQAFPVDPRTAMRTARAAATERLALPAAPQRRQLTVGPTPTPPTRRTP